MALANKTFSKTRRIFGTIVAFVMILAGFLAILLSSKQEAMSFVSLVTGAKTAYADFPSDNPDGSDSKDTSGQCDEGCSDGDG